MEIVSSDYIMEIVSSDYIMEIVSSDYIAAIVSNDYIMEIRYDWNSIYWINHGIVSITSRK